MPSPGPHPGHTQASSAQPHPWGGFPAVWPWLRGCPSPGLSDLLCKMGVLLPTALPRPNATAQAPSLRPWLPNCAPPGCLVRWGDGESGRPGGQSGGGSGSESGRLHPKFPFCSLPQASSPCGVGPKLVLGVGWRRWGGGLLGC